MDDPTAQFEGLPETGFELFSMPDRDRRRREIIETIHPPLGRLGSQLLRSLDPGGGFLHKYLPRLDWPRDYEPFCTWLALSADVHGYQRGPQLNVGVHASFVAARLGWDAGADDFGRFEFLVRHAGLGEQLVGIARRHGLVFRVFGPGSWPEGAPCLFEAPADIRGSFAEVRRRGVWWELGQHYAWPDARTLICSPALGAAAQHVMECVLPVFDRLVGHRPPD